MGLHDFPIAEAAGVHLDRLKSDQRVGHLKDRSQLSQARPSALEVADSDRQLETRPGIDLRVLNAQNRPFELGRAEGAVIGETGTVTAAVRATNPEVVGGGRAEVLQTDGVIHDEVADLLSAAVVRACPVLDHGARRLVRQPLHQHAVRGKDRDGWTSRDRRRQRVADAHQTVSGHRWHRSRVQ